jgi:hypothetical protein
VPGVGVAWAMGCLLVLADRNFADAPRYMSGL